MKRVLLLILFSGLMFLCPTIAKMGTKGFRLGKLALDLYSNPAWETAPPDSDTLAQVQAMLRRPLRYLSHGAQSFVFATEDGEYIVKLFRYDQRVHPWREWIRTQILGKRKRLRHDEKIHSLFVACKLAYEQASDLTGLLYVHLNQTKELLPKALFIDSLGRKYSLDMNRLRFVIQHRGRPVREVLREAIQAKDRAKCERLIDSFASLLNERTERKIRNSDTKVAPNFGFWGEKAIEWDFGNYWIDSQMEDPAFRDYEKGLFSQQMRRFLVRTAPEYVAYYDQKIGSL